MSGTWRLTIRDPDGTVVSRHVFENTYNDFSNRLPKILSHQEAAGLWRLYLGRPLGAGPCLDSLSALTPCILGESSDPGVSPSLQKTLVVTQATKAVELDGTVTIQANDQIRDFNTTLGFCVSSVATDSCTGIDTLGFTAHDLGAGNEINVSTGQMIDVSFTLSFS